MYLGHKFGATLYLIDIILFIGAPIMAFLTPKGRLKYFAITLSFFCLFSFAGFTAWIINALNHIGPK
jgi:hypothetical protein